MKLQKNITKIKILNKINNINIIIEYLKIYIINNK